MHPPKTLVHERDAVARSIAAKLREAGLDAEASKLERCREQAGWMRCEDCDERWPTRHSCNRRWCPFCAQRIAARRCAYVSAWFKIARQPKHVVLTGRNSAEIPLRRYASAFTKLRRQRAFRWRDGVRNLEVTNEGRGWHVHIHAAVDTRWVDLPELARRWGRLLGQEFAIVYARDAREMTYLAELAKYAAKPAQVSTWPAAELAALVRALKRVRLFAAFGNARGLHVPREKCTCPECGGPNVTFEPMSLVEEIDARLDRPWIYPQPHLA